MDAKRIKLSSPSPQPTPPATTTTTVTPTAPVPNTTPVIPRSRPSPLQPQDVALVPKVPTLLPVSVPASSAKVKTNTDDGYEAEGFFATEDHPLSKKGFRYAHCCGMPALDKVLYSLVEVEPFGPRISYEDRSPNVYISTDALICTTTAGYRSARANVGVSSGSWYLEFDIINANNSSNSSANSNSNSNGDDTQRADDAHVRIGWTRREASLEAPVGHDAYGYGFRDATGEKLHVSRPKPYMNEGFSSGDVIGLLISLPSSNDTNHNHSPPGPSSSSAKSTTSGNENNFPNVVRDRIPIRYKGQLLFEILDYVPIKPMDELILPTNLFKKKRENYVPPTIPGSYIQVFKNGRDMGVAFEDLVDFRSPHSKYPSHVAKPGGANADDGQLGYYPTISVFRGGQARFNFGPDFAFPPPSLADKLGPEKKIKPLCLRYDQQIAEDIVYDIIDQIDLEIVDSQVLSSISQPTVSAGLYGVVPM